MIRMTRWRKNYIRSYTSTTNPSNLTRRPSVLDEQAATHIPVRFQDVAKARLKIQSSVKKTYFGQSVRLSELTGIDIWLKHEQQHFTGSFKERGARNALEQLTPQQKKIGVVAASAGNHAQALSRHGSEMGIPVTVIMPTIAPLTKVRRCRDFGANVIVEGDDIAASKQIAMKRFVEAEGFQYINGFDDPEIIAGQGTMGLEMIEQEGDLDAVVVPIGGGGLIAGMALAIKTLNPRCEIIGVEPERCASYQRALDMGKPEKVLYDRKVETLADGLAVPEVGMNAFELARDLVDRVIQVDEKSIAIACLRLLELDKLIIEGSGSTGLAGILSGQLDDLKGKKVGIPLCGGNIDTPVLGRVLDRGLAADGRLVKFDVRVSDRPGGVNSLTTVIRDCGASIKDIYHERAFLHTNIHSVNVKVVAETTSMEHGQELLALLQADFGVENVIWYTS
eukprot:g2149.t1